MADYIVKEVYGVEGTILRRGAAMDSEKVGDLPGGTAVRVAEETTVKDRKGNDCVRARLEAPEGWVSLKTLEAAPVSPPPAPPAAGFTREMGEKFSNARYYVGIACARGIPATPRQLIRADDSAWVSLRARARPFAKHGFDPRTGMMVCAEDSYIVGDAACGERGIDLRYAVPNVVMGNESPGLLGLVRFSRQCRLMGSRMPGFETVHGGAVHSACDEFMCEHFKATTQPSMLTTTFSARLHRECKPDVTYALRSWYAGPGAQPGFTRAYRMEVADPEGVVVASATSEQVDLLAMKLPGWTMAMSEGSVGN